MRISTAIGCCLVVTAMGACGQEPAPAAATGAVAGVKSALTCDQPVYDFQEVYAGQVISHSFVLQNQGTNAVRILHVQTTCGCTTTALATNSLAPGQSTDLTANLDLKGRAGSQRKHLYVESDDPVSPRLSLEMNGVVITPVEARPAGVHFGTLARDGDAEQEVLLVARTGVVFHVKEVRMSAPEFTASVEAREEGKVYSVKIRSMGPRLAGTSQASALVLTDHPAMPQLNIPVTVLVATDIVAAPARLILVQGATNVVRTYYVGIHSPAKKPFSITKLEPPGEALNCNLVMITPDRYRIEIKAAGDLSGMDGQSVRIGTDMETMKELVVPVRVIAGPGAPVPPSK